MIERGNTMAQMSLENLLRAVLEGGVDGAKAEAASLVIGEIVDTA